jgi:hypothetical protein
VPESGPAISENSSKKRGRGRPRLVWTEIEDSIKRSEGVLSRRAAQNAGYKATALTTLFPNGESSGAEFTWLYDNERARRREPRHVRGTILAELGRIDDDDDLRAVARRVCELKPKTRAAVAMIRRWRVGPPTPRPGRLAAELLSTINDYLARYPTASYGQALTDLNAVRTVLEEHAARDEP